MLLAHSTPEDITRVLQTAPAVLIPIGAMEWHDSHLPIGFDFLKVEVLCQKIAENVGCFCAPSIAFGYPHHMSKDPIKGPATFCPEFEALHNYILAIGKVMVDKGFKVIYFLTGHYERSQLYMVKLIARLLVDYARDNGKDIIALAHHEPDYTIHEGISQNAREDPRRGNDPKVYCNGDHAGFYETGLGLLTNPNLVQMDKLKKNYWHPEFGKPSKEFGERWLNMIITKATEEINAALKGKEL